MRCLQRPSRYAWCAAGADLGGCLRRRARTLAAATLALAIAVKFLPAVLVPFYWRRVRIRDGLLAAVVAALLYVPFLGRGSLPIGSVGIFVQRFRFNGPIFAVLEP